MCEHYLEDDHPAQNLPRCATVPLHVATNIDGARRWAVQHGIALDKCYDRGFVQVQAIADECIHQGIPALTLHIVRDLRRTLRGYQQWSVALADFARLALEYLPQWHDTGIRLHLMGDIDGILAPQRDILRYVAEQTCTHDRLHLSMAINYSSRSDVIQAARRLAAQCVEGTLTPDEITDQMYADHLWSSTLPPELRTVQMLIITGGVRELDDFMQVEAALARVFFSDLLWPEFNVAEFRQMLERYAVDQRAVRSYETWLRNK